MLPSKGLLLVILEIVVLLANSFGTLAEASKNDAELDKGRFPRSKDSGLFGDSDSEPVPLVLDKNGEEEHKIGFLPLPPGYNKLVIPLGNISKEIFVMVYLSVREIVDVDTNNGIIEMDTEMGVTWIDWEVWKYFIQNEKVQKNAQSGPEEITLDAEFLKQIWKPDIFIEEMASVERTSLLAKLINLRFLVKNPVMPGAITFEARQTFKLRCEMDFHYYPADIQICPLSIRSYSYTQEQLFLLWNPSQSVFLDQTADSNFDFQISNVEPGEKLYDLFTKSQAPCCQHRNYSTLSFTLQIRRNLTYHFVQTCIPSILLILITWLCFLLPPDMVEVRIGISMTTLLTLTAMFGAVREQAPAVSYTMAIDVWMVFCMVLLFLALCLFTVIYWLRRKSKDTAANNNLEETVENGIPPTKKPPQIRRYSSLAKNIKAYSFWLFACLFIGFIIFFFTWLLTASDYYSWDPSPKYNTVEADDDGNSTAVRLFSREETTFKPTSKKKTVESTFRFKDIFKNVIFPRLQQLQGNEESEEGDEASYEIDPDDAETTTLGLIQDGQ